MEAILETLKVRKVILMQVMHIHVQYTLNILDCCTNIFITRFSSGCQEALNEKTFKAISVRYTFSDDDSYQLFYNLNIVRTPDHRQSHDKWHNLVGYLQNHFLYWVVLIFFLLAVYKQMFFSLVKMTWLVCFTVVNCSLTNGQAGKMIFFAPRAGLLYWMALRFLHQLESLWCVLEQVTLPLHCPLKTNPKKKTEILTKCCSYMCFDRLTSQQGFINILDQNFRNKIFWSNADLKNLW